MKRTFIYIIFFLSCFFSNNIAAETMLPPGDSTIIYNGCQGDGYEVLVAGNVYNELNPTGSETFVAGSFDGTDSLVTINLSFNPNPVPLITGSTTFCYGDCTTLDAGIFQSYTWSDGSTNQVITICYQGTYSLTVSDANGCQGSATVTVTESFIPSPDIQITETSGAFDDDGIICAGDNAILFAGFYSSYAWSTGENTQTITVNSNGEYHVTVTNSNGCAYGDTITIIENALPTPIIIGSENSGNTNNDGIICDNDNIILSTNQAYDTYQWSTGSNVPNISVQIQGTYSVTVSDFDGCEGSAEYTVFTNPVPNTPIITATETSGSVNDDGIICAGNNDPVLLNPGFYAEYWWATGDNTQIITVTQPGTYSVTVVNTNGCHSEASYTISTENITGEEVHNGCAGDGYDVIVNGTNYDETNPTGIEYIDIGTGCDSVVNVNLTFNQAIGNENHIGCEGDGYSANVNGVTYNEGNSFGTETIVGGSYLGCDSIVTVNLVFSAASIGSENYTGCQGDGYEDVINGTAYNEANPSGIEVITNGNYLGCDSTVTINMVFNAPSSGTEDYYGCQGDGYQITVNGTIYHQNNPSGIEVINNGNYLGCDSTVYIDLIYNDSPNNSETYYGCQGDGYEVIVNGTVYNEANAFGYESMLTTLGCDSTITINLFFNSSGTGTEAYLGCPGDGYEVDVNGTTYNEANPTGTEMFTGIWGCDTTVNINLVFDSAANTTTGTETYTGNEGDGYEVTVNGTVYNETNPMGTETLTNVLGCDSIVTVDLVFYAPTTGFLDYQGCSGDGYEVIVNGVAFNETNPSGTEVIVGGSASGLDSTVIINFEFTTLSVSLSTDINNINCENQTATITSTLTGLPDSPTYTWSNGANTADITVSDIGNYTLAVSEATGCISVAAITITESIPTECVFPGDANYDFVVNSLDHLTVCLAGGDMGPARQTQGINFLPHYIQDWNDEVYTGLDKKHLDCDGSGMINFQDLDAVFDNYNSLHDGVNPLRIADAPTVRLVFDDLYTIEGGNTTVTGNIILDNPDTQEDIIDLYGILFTIEYDELFIEEGTFNITYLDNGWIGTAAEISPLYKDFYDQGFMDIAFTRGDQTPRSGSGVIATVEFVIEDNLIGLTADYEIEMNVTDVYAHDNNASPIAFNAEAENVNVSITSTHDILSEDLIDVYPNPTNGELVIDMNDLSGESYALYSTIGQLVDEHMIVSEITELDLKNLSAGIYILNIKAAEGSINVKVIVK